MVSGKTPIGFNLPGKPFDMLHTVDETITAVGLKHAVKKHRQKNMICEKAIVYFRLLPRAGSGSNQNGGR